MGLVRAILDGSKLVQEERDQAAAEGLAKGLAEGLAEGEAKGQAKGQAAEARRVLRLLLRKQFPELESLAEIDGISNVEALESIIESVFDASGAGPVRAAILTAAKPN